MLVEPLLSQDSVVWSAESVTGVVEEGELCWLFVLSSLSLRAV